MSIDGRTVLISPTFNEALNVPPLVESFFRHAPAATLLIVDDGSPDGTAAVCKGLQDRYPNLRLLERKGQRGLGRAYLAGISWALENGFEAIGTMDADLSHDPERLPAMFAAIETADVVIGSRYIKDGGTVNWGIRRILLSWTANRFTAQVLAVPAHDVTSGYRLYRASALRRIDWGGITSTGYSFLVELLWRLHKEKCSIREVPIVFFDRTMGKSKMAGREIFVGAFRVLGLRIRRPRPVPPAGGGEAGS